MKEEYLSPTFSRRSQEELEFLRKIDGTTGFSLFWIDIIKPLLCALKARHLLEIGADEGSHTRLLLDYCGAFNADLTVIEPSVKPVLKEIIGSSPRVSLFAQKSHEALPRINVPIDAVILEGDLNYYATYGDLTAIKELCRRQGIPFPVILVKNVSWPYARRDMYYYPEGLLPGARYDYDKSGMTPWAPGLKEGMINYPFANAGHEGGAKNGVLTAVEDFIKDSKLDLRLFSLPLNNGMGIIYAANSKAEQFIKSNFILSPPLRLFLETFELSRLNDIIRRLRPPQVKRGFRNRLAGVLRRLGRAIARAIEG